MLCAGLLRPEHLLKTNSESQVHFTIIVINLYVLKESPLLPSEALIMEVFNTEIERSVQVWSSEELRPKIWVTCLKMLRNTA